jgi:hypothetical protein
MPDDTLWYVLVSFGGGTAGGFIGSLPAWLHWWRHHDDDDEPRPLPQHTSDADPGPAEDDAPSAPVPLPPHPGNLLERDVLHTPPLRHGDTLTTPIGAITQVVRQAGISVDDMRPVDWREVEDRPLLDVARARSLDDAVETIEVDLPPAFMPEPPTDTPTRWVRTPRVLHLRGCHIARARGVDVPADTVQAAVAYAAEQRPPLRFCHECHPAAEMTQQEEVRPWPAT